MEKKIIFIKNTYIIIFFQLRNHNNNWSFFTPNHSPEIYNGMRHRTLCCYVGVWFTFIPLKYTEIYNVIIYIYCLFVSIIHTDA